jgi:voltage-gated potassium channel
VIVLGYTGDTSPIVDELGERAGFVVLTPDDDVASRLRDRGTMTVTANPSNESALERARVEKARAVVAATADDADDALAVLTARQMNPDLRIVVSAADEENVRKLRRAGADTVISPASIVGDLLVESALTGEDTGTVADEVLGEELEGDDGEGEG